MNVNSAFHSVVDVHELFDRMSPEKQKQAAAGARAWYAAILLRPLSRKRNCPEIKKVLHAFSSVLVNYRNESELLEALLALGRLLGICRIRYYHYDARNKTLRSIDCAGHPSDEALRLRLGNILKPRQDCPPESSDSYVCIDRREPVCFEIDPSLETSMAERSPCGSMQMVVLAGSQCHDVLSDSPFRFRADYPLIHAGEVVGKLSCDLDATEITPRLIKRLLWFWKKALRIAAPIEGLRTSRIESVVPIAETIRDEVLTATTMRKLFDYCVEELPRRFNIRHASFFTVSTDALGSTRLVLRRTSYSGSRHLEDGARGTGDQVGYYQMERGRENGITVWVAIHKRPVRIQHLTNPGLLRAQLAALDPALQWRNKIQDSDTHTSFLAVPILAGNRLLGVLRFTEKAAGDANAYFTDIDEQCLFRIAGDHIGPRLAELQIREAQSLFCDEAWQQPIVKALAETFEPTNHTDLARRRKINFQKAMRHLFREDNRSRHLYLVNHVPANENRFTHLAVAGTLASQMEPFLHNSYDLEGTLTGQTLREQKWVYLHDIPYARDRGYIRPLLPETASVLACPITLGARGRGAIVMHSDRQDIVPEVHGPLLHYLISLTSAVLTCRCRPESEYV